MYLTGTYMYMYNIHVDGTLPHRHYTRTCTCTCTMHTRTMRCLERQHNTTEQHTAGIIRKLATTCEVFEPATLTFQVMLVTTCTKAAQLTRPTHTYMYMCMYMQQSNYSIPNLHVHVNEH